MILNFGCETQERYTLEGIYAGWQRKMDVAALEVQGAKDPEFAKRMFKYYYRILDRYDKPVSALAIFSGRDGKKMPDRFEDHCLETRQLYQYNTMCITDYPDEVLTASNNPFAVVVLCAVCEARNK